MQVQQPLAWLRCMARQQVQSAGSALFASLHAFVFHLLPPAPVKPILWLRMPHTLLQAYLWQRTRPLRAWAGGAARGHGGPWRQARSCTNSCCDHMRIGLLP